MLQTEAAFRRWPIAVIAAGIILLLLPAGVGELQLDAPMYAFLAKRVAATGEWSSLYFDWDGNYPYFNKPPLVFWLTALVMKLLGQTVLATRIVPAAMYIAAALLLQRLVRTQYGPLIAWTAAGALLVQREVLANVLEVRMDGALLVASVLTSFGLVRLVAGKGSIFTGFAVVGAGIGFGLLARGGLILMAFPVLVISLAWRRQWKALTSIPGWLTLLAIAFAIASPWYFWQWHRWAGASTRAYYGDTIRQHLLADPHGTLYLALYYIRRLPEVYVLWLLPALAGAAVLYRRKALGPVDIVGLTWIGVCFTLIHFTTMRAPQYLLQCFPWLGVLAAIGLCEFRPAVAAWWSRWGTVVLPALAVVIAGITVLQGRQGKGIAAQTMPELRAVAADIYRDIGHAPGTPPPISPVAWIPARRNEWQRFCAIEFHTGLRVFRLPLDIGLPAEAKPGDYIFIFADKGEPPRELGLIRNNNRATLGTAQLQELDDGKRLLIYKILTP